MRNGNGPALRALRTAPPEAGLEERHAGRDLRSASLAASTKNPQYKARKELNAE